MASSSSNRDSGARSLSMPLQRAMDRLLLSLPTESGRETANVPLQSNHVAPSACGSDVPSSSTSLPTPATFHPIPHSAADPKQTQSQQEGSVATQSYVSNRTVKTVLAIIAHFTNLYIKDWVPHVLLPVEVQQYRQDIHRRIQKIRDLEAEQMQMMPKRLPHLEENLFVERLKYKIHFGRIFRINDLPPEVLSNVFRYVIWSAMGQEYGIQWRLWMSWVCRHWRAVALSDPMLWNAIWFKDLPDFERSFTWLDRSANAPLDIRINDTKERPISVPEMHNLLNRLFDKLSNIRIFIIILQEWDPILVVLHAFSIVQEKNLPMIMERFEMHRAGSPYVQVGAGYEPSFYLNPIPLFGGATVPSFNYLSLNGLHIDWTNSVITNLTTLDIRRIPLEKSPTLSQFRAFLTNSPSLRKLFLDGAGPGWTSDMTRGVKPIHIPSLRILILGDMSLSYSIYVCSQIFAPNVLDLTLLNLIGEDYSRLYDLFRSNMPQIRILTLYNVDFIGGPRASISVIKWLQSMPLLTYFRIGNVKPHFLELFLYNYKTMRSLAQSQTPSGHIPCPKLSCLEYDGVQTDVIARWAGIRKQLGSPLRKIYLAVSVAKEATREQYQRLAEAVDGVGGIQTVIPGIRPPEETSLAM